MEIFAEICKDNRFQYLIASSAAIGFISYAVIKYWSASSSSQNKPNVVYVHTFAPTTKVVNPSPFGLKLQTYFRMAGNKIPFKLEFNRPFGKTNKSPWIEFNDRQILDSSLGIEFLNEEFKVTIDDHLTEEQRALGKLLQKTIEENTFWAVIAYNRMIEDFDWFLKSAKRVPWLQKKIAKFTIKGRVQKILCCKGLGRHSPETIRDIGKKDLKAFSAILDDKPYFLGDQQSLIDAIIFSILANIIYALSEMSWPNVYIREHCPNLIEYTERIKNKYWDDWDDILAK